MLSDPVQTEPKMSKSLRFSYKNIGLDVFGHRPAKPTISKRLRTSPSETLSRRFRVRSDGTEDWKPPRTSSTSTLSRVSSRPRDCALDGVHRLSGGAAAFARAWELQCSAFAALQHRCNRVVPCLARRNKLSERRWASERDILACQAFFGASATFGPFGHVFSHSSCGAHRHRVTQCECWLDHVIQWPSSPAAHGRCFATTRAF